MAYCTDSFAQGWATTIRLLFKPVRLIFWIKLAILIFIAQAFSSFSSLFTQRFDPETLFETHKDNLMNAVPEFVVFLTGLILTVIIYSLIMSATRVMFYDAVLRGATYYFRSFTRHLATIVSYFLWNIVTQIAFLAIVFVVTIIGILLAGITAAALNNEAVIGVFFLIAILIALIFLVLGILYWIVLDGMVVPVMVASDLGIFAAWGKSLRLVFSHFGDFIGFSFIRLIVSLTKFMIVLVVNAIVMFSVFGMSFQDMIEGQRSFQQNIQLITFLIPIGFFLSLFLLPLPILRDGFSLRFLAALTGDKAFVPEGDEPVPGPNREPAPSFSTEPPVYTGPISFSDIPAHTPEPENGVEDETPAEEISVEDDAIPDLDELDLESEDDSDSSPDRPRDGNHPPPPPSM